MKRAVESSPNEYLFPRYCSEQGCKADYASNSLNKWLRQHVPSGCVFHSFRHSMRDRLRAVGCPAEVIDQIGGWTTSGIGQITVSAIAKVKSGIGCQLLLRRSSLRKKAHIPISTK